MDSCFAQDSDTAFETLRWLGLQLCKTVEHTVPPSFLFFSGFGFMLYGVKKVTHDIDIVASTQQTQDLIISHLLSIGFKHTMIDIITSLKHAQRNISVDISVDRVCLQKLPKSIWSRATYVVYNKVSFPVPSTSDLVVLKSLVHSRRSKGHPKAHGDVKDISRLFGLMNINSTQLKLVASEYGLASQVTELLRKALSVTP
jgi:hypothetical protein